MTDSEVADRVAAATGDVDLIVNCFERTYREVLKPGFFDQIAADNARDFALKTALINNVEDRGHAQEKAEALVMAGEIDRFLFVSDEIDQALLVCGLTSSDLGPVPYFTDFALVAVAAQGPEWFLLWDANVRINKPVDWVTPGIDLLERDPRAMCAGPNWRSGGLDGRYFEPAGDFVLGQGFTDQVVLGRRSDFAAPIYRESSISLWRYPMSHLTTTFEARIDAHMRRSKKLLATHRVAVYDHQVEMGTSWPHRSLYVRAVEARNHLAISILKLMPWRPKHLRQL